MTKRHFHAAAEQVKAILAGEWTNELPSWVDQEFVVHHAWIKAPSTRSPMLRAIQTAEAYILLFTRFNPQFNVETFLVACGLKEKPSKKVRD